MKTTLVGERHSFAPTGCLSPHNRHGQGPVAGHANPQNQRRLFALSRGGLLGSTERVWTASVSTEIHRVVQAAPAGRRRAQLAGKVWANGRQLLAT